MNKSKNGNNENINKELEELAGKVLALKKQYHQRRPIVIEFCGSPKAGKTSCINSLNIFLKRNGFKTYILNERASNCPIEDKHNPIFNVWTCSSTINELNEKMDKVQRGEEIDIIISDRGIFDALCWFGWLKEQSNMSDEEYRILSSFATLYRWQKNIDLVYVFVASPEVSINREYANLLTKKRGSIMQENVLAQYKSSVEKTINSYSEQFRNVVRIDTTFTTQKEVGYDVIVKTLEILKNMLMEKIGYINVASSDMNRGFSCFDDILPLLRNYEFDSREKIESDTRVIQPIPVAIIVTQKRDKILCVKKTKKSTSKGSPEYGKLLFYVGGHTRLEDDPHKTNRNFLKTIENTLERELIEELGLAKSLNQRKPDFCLYTPDYNEISRKHLAIGWIIEVAEDTKFNLDNYELTQTKGTSKSGRFLTFSDIEKLVNSNKELVLESWSRDILLKFFRDKFSTSFINYLEEQSTTQQLTLFDTEL